jgi:hypothetical protein
MSGSAAGNRSVNAVPLNHGSAGVRQRDLRIFDSFIVACQSILV